MGGMPMQGMPNMQMGGMQMQGMPMGATPNVQAVNILRSWAAEWAATREISVS